MAECVRKGDGERVRWREKLCVREREGRLCREKV